MKRVQKGHVTLKWYVGAGDTDATHGASFHRALTSLLTAGSAGTWAVSLDSDRCGSGTAGTSTPSCKLEAARLATAVALADCHAATSLMRPTRTPCP